MHLHEVLSIFWSSHQFPGFSLAFPKALCLLNSYSLSWKFYYSSPRGENSKLPFTFGRVCWLAGRTGIRPFKQWVKKQTKPNQVEKSSLQNDCTGYSGYHQDYELQWAVDWEKKLTFSAFPPHSCSFINSYKVFWSLVTIGVEVAENYTYSKLHLESFTDKN